MVFQQIMVKQNLTIKAYIKKTTQTSEHKVLGFGEIGVKNQIFLSYMWNSTWPKS